MISQKVKERARPAVQMTAPVLSVVVPTYNEAGNMAALVEKLSEALGPVSWELIVADDNSPDGTHRLAKAFGAADHRIRCLRRVGRRGLAGACIDGILSSSAPYVAVMDGDLQHDEAILQRMLRRLEDGDADVIIGSRYCDGGSPDGFSGIRGAMSRFATMLAQSLTGVVVSDPMSGFFAARREVFETYAPDLSHDGFKILLDLLATARGQLVVAEEPYGFRARHEGESKFDLRTGLEYLGLLAAKATRDVIEPRFVPYAFVGGLGLLVHFAILKSALSQFEFHTAQSIATLGAMLANFFLNNTLTYKDMRLSGWKMLKGAMVYCAISATGFVANIGVASWLYAERPSWWLAGAAGAIIGAVWNYAMSSRLVWRLH
ncbi:MAG: glycosyltransferase family 2 protein [Rhizomicrobium sp.]